MTERTGEEREFSLRYDSGEEVREGDRVRFRDEEGVAAVVKVIRPGAKEHGEYDWACPEGGVLVEGPPFGLVAQGNLDEIVFVGRGEVSEEWKRVAASEEDWRAGRVKMGTAEDVMEALGDGTDGKRELGNGVSLNPMNERLFWRCLDALCDDWENVESVLAHLGLTVQSAEEVSACLRRAAAEGLVDAFSFSPEAGYVRVEPPDGDVARLWFFVTDKGRAALEDVPDAWVEG